MLDLAPGVIQLRLRTGSTGVDLKDVDNGKTMTALGIVGGESMMVLYRPGEEYIPQAAILGADGQLTPAARRIFSGWYDMYSNADGRFTRESAAHFILGCCGDRPAPNDQRICGLIPAQEGEKEPSITKEAFLDFYKACSRSEKSRAVRENLGAFNVRPDLKKWSDV